MTSTFNLYGQTMVIAHGLVTLSAILGPLCKDNPLIKQLIYASVIGFKLSVVSP